jgi:mannose-6-phosphate isomerase-like protein (cupin superfamily)
MIPQKINLKEKLELFSALWSPKVIAELNDIQLKLVKLEGDFVWHAHEESDELFFVVEGELDIEFREGHIHLSQGELCVVPKGVEHKPRAEMVCHVLLIEPRGVINTGEVVDELTAPNDEWV